MGTNIFLKIFLDIFLLACVAAPLLGFFWVEPFHRGFFYDDHSIRLPVRNQTVPTYIIAPLVVIIPLLVILITEIIHRKSDKNADERPLGNKMVPGWLWACYCGMGTFIFGMATQQLTATIAKYALGRFRPNFIAVCEPSFNIPDPLFYIPADAFICTNNPGRLALKDLRLSFPSAHSSASMYAAVFLMLYFHHYWRWEGSKLFRHALQLLVFLCALYVGFTRIQDHVHHWDDVAVGFLLGAAVALLVFFYVLKPKKLWHPVIAYDHRDLETAHPLSPPQQHLPRVALGNGSGHLTYN